VAVAVRVLQRPSGDEVACVVGEDSGQLVGAARAVQLRPGGRLLDLRSVAAQQLVGKASGSLEQSQQ
jgi:hypothetical protein